MKGNTLTGKGKITAVVTAGLIGLGLTVVPLASAYEVPGPPGTPGGQPTSSTGGSASSKSATHVAATALAGYTGVELSKLTPKVTLPPSFHPHGVRAGSAASTGSYAKSVSFSFSCLVSVGKSKIGSGASHNGARSLRISFTKHGRQYLVSHNGKPIRLGVKCTFVPKHGKKSVSASTVVLSA